MRFFLLSLLCLSLPHQTASAQSTRTLQSFSELRSEVLTLISGATQRIWLATGYLTDGDIVSALYVAQYRKLNVTVLLGRARANHYMSRLNYLKNQNIPVFLQPPTYKSKYQTSILVDDRLLEATGDLDFLAKYKKVDLQIASPADTQTFASLFSQAASTRVEAKAHAVPLVGRARNHSNVYSPTTKLSLPESAGDPGEAYRYDRKQTPRPEGVPSKLPKVLKHEKKGSQSDSSDDL